MLAQRMIDTLGNPFSIGGNILHISARVGIALFPNDGLTASGGGYNYAIVSPSDQPTTQMLK